MAEQSKKARQLLLGALTAPEQLGQLTIQEWELLTRCARQSKLVAALGASIALNAPEVVLPEKVHTCFAAAQQLVDYRKKMIMWELRSLKRIVSELDVDVIVLKGGAYILLELPMAIGRSLSDIDILVEKNDLQRVEQQLVKHGWIETALDEYDEYYYRTWMHEIPPMRHRERFVEVDIHHTITPLTSQLKLDADKLFKEAVNVSDTDLNKVLSSYDMVLHSSLHLFYDAELNEGDFRDLVDLHELFSFFSAKDVEFWDKLDHRAEELGLQTPLFYSLYFTKKMLATPVPDSLLKAKKLHPTYLAKQVMNYLVPLALLPEHPDYPSQKVAFIRWLLYVRSHYLRMPLTLLIPHLFKKSKKRFETATN